MRFYKGLGIGHFDISEDSSSDFKPRPGSRSLQQACKGTTMVTSGALSVRAAADR
jgi:hypothetical protein